MHIYVISLFPEMFESLNYGIPGRAQQHGQLNLRLLNPRNFTQDKRRQVDDRPYGGGPGMVLKVEPLQAAIHAALQLSSDLTLPISYLSPQGQCFNHSAALALSQRQQIILVAGRYEGMDERIHQMHLQEEWSLGDFVLSGGEPAAVCMIDAICRLLPGVLGNSYSIIQDSFYQNLLDYPHYTRPRTFLGRSIPQILHSGNHAAISNWRLQQSLGRTWLKRPELLQKRGLNEQEEVLLKEFIQAYQRD